MADLRRVDFLRRKYGPELLVDIAYVRAMPSFPRDDAYTLSFYDILLVTAGSGRFWLDGTAYPVRPGQVFFTTPGQPRRLLTQGLDGPCLFFPREFLLEFFSDPLFLQRLRFFHNARIAPVLSLGPRRAKEMRARLDAMARELRRLRDDSVHLLRAQLYELLVTLNRWFAEAHDLPAAGEPSPFTLRLLEAVERDFATQHRPAHYARRLGLSAAHLNAIVKRELGQTAGQLVRGRLLIEARRLLRHSDETVARIADRLGFEDAAYFSRFFRRESGVAPLAWRQRP